MREIPDLPPEPNIIPGLATVTGGARRLDEISIHHLQKEKFSQLPRVRPSDFRVLQLIGAGDTGRVYLVEKQSSAFIPEAHSQTLFALKVISQHDLRKRNKMRRFEAEYDILLSSNHPFLMKMYTAFSDERNYYILLEFAAGSDMAALLRREPGNFLSEPCVLHYASEILSALEYLHFNGIIYRDLKTENILIHQDGHCRLTDFDLSKRLLEARDLSSLFPQDLFEGKKRASIFPTAIFEQTTSFVGTAEYLSPDVLNGAHSQASDFWSFGVLLYELLYGVTPFFVPNGGFQQIKRRIQAGIYTFPKTHQTSSEAKDLISKLLVADPTKRLGYRYGAAEIKRHKWFSRINFAAIYPPPIKIEFDEANPLTSFKEFPRAAEETARDLAGTDFLVPPKVMLYYTEVQQAYLKAGLPAKPKLTDMFAENSNDAVNIRENGIGTIAGASGKNDSKRAKLTELFKKREAPQEGPTIPTIAVNDPITISPQQEQVENQEQRDDNISSQIGLKAMASPSSEENTSSKGTTSTEAMISAGSAAESEPTKVETDVRKSIFEVQNEDEM